MLAFVAEQSVGPAEELIDAFDGRAALPDEPGEEQQHLLDVAFFRCIDLGPEKHPERPLDLEFREGSLLVQPEPQLLVEAEDGGGQVKFLLAVVVVVPQVENAEVLPVAVGVEEAVAVVEEDPLSVTGGQFRVRGESLVEGGAVFGSAGPLDRLDSGSTAASISPGRQ